MARESRDPQAMTPHRHARAGDGPARRSRRERAIHAGRAWTSWFAAALLLLLAGLAPASADEFRPAYLQLTQRDANTYDVLWKLPALDESTALRLRPEFPAGTETLGAIRSAYAAGTAVQHWRIRVDGGLEGKTIEFPEAAASRIDVLVRIARIDGTEQLDRALPIAPRVVVTAHPGALEVVRAYTVLGVEHILTGIDHLLFVLALLLLVDGTRRLIATITAFTIAHSLTLATASLGIVDVPGPPVEAAIALSIVFVAAEIVHARRGASSLTQRRPWLVAFAFGLLHGLGFAGALAEVGLPQQSIPIALLFFNIGVEIGQLLFVAAVLGAIAAGRRIAGLLALAWPQWLWHVPPYAIGGVAGFWAIERIAAF
jgi:hydrogenase/urease accessory protein HupE